MSSPYTHNDIQNALDSYGTDFTRWPDPKMAAYVKDNEAYHDAIKSMAVLDATLSSHTIPTPSDVLKARILKQASETAQVAMSTSNVNTPQSSRVIENTQLRPSRIAGWMRIAAILLVSAVVGGSFWFNQAPSPVEPEPVLIASLDAETDAWRSAANDMDMMDIFLWVETDS